MSLRETIRQLIKSGVDTNVALNALVSDYARFHWALVIVGGVFLVALAIGSVLLWRQFARAVRKESGRSTFERFTYVGFGVLTAVVAFALALILAGNVGNAVRPERGLLGALGQINTSAELQQAFVAWLASGDQPMPTLIQQHIDDRLSWQLPKAVICLVLLIGFIALSFLIWRSLIRRSRSRPHQQRLVFWTLFAVGAVCVTACLLLMLMVMGNTQAAVAPRALVLVFG